MFKNWQFLCFLLLLSFQLQGQLSDNPQLEKDIKHILALEKKAHAETESQEKKSNLFLEAIQKSYEALDKYDLSCDQKGRLFLKIGSYHFYNFEDNQAISILKDSVLGTWLNCPGLNDRWLWDPAVLLFDLYIINNRLIDAGEINKLIDSKPLIFKGVKPRNIQQFYSSLGFFAAEINDKTLSIQSLKKAVQLLEDVKDPSLYFGLHNDFANSLYRLGDFPNSIVQYEKALNYAESEQNKITVIVNYTEILIQNGDIQKADSLLNSISDFIAKDSRFYRYKMIYLQRKATIKNKQGAYQEAISFMKEANEEIKDKEDAFVSRAVNLSKMATSHYGLKEYSTGDEKVLEAINLLLATRDNVDILNGESITSHVSYNFRELLSILSNLVFEKLEMDDSKSAIFILNEIQKLIDHNKQKLSGESSKIFQTSSIYPIYEKTIDNLVEAYYETKNESYLNQAIQLSLTNKGNILTDIISEKQIYERELPSSEYERFKKLEFNKNSAESDVVNANSKNLDSLNNRYFEALTSFNKYQDSLLQIHSTIRPMLSNNSMNLNVEDVVAYLGSDRAYLEIFAGQNAMYLFCISKNAKSVFKVPLTEDVKNKFDQYLSELYQYNDDTDFYDRSQYLYDLLYKNPFDHFEKIGLKSIITSSDGVFHMVPIESFWNGKSFLVEDFDISYILSNNQLNAQKNKYSQEYIGFGSSYSSQLNDHLNNATGKSDIRLSSLQQAEKEVANGTQILGGKNYVGRNATKSNFKKYSSENSGILHLALHGIILNNSKSGIVFHDEEQDFILDQLELGMMKLKNKLTILSACHSGSGEVFQGEGIRSLARSFLYAGSNSVISSLWEASDVSNQEIMTRLLENISDGRETHESLNQAKRDYLKNASPYARHPAYWGNMVYVGADKSTSSFGLKYILLALGFLAIVFILYKVRK